MKPFLKWPGGKGRILDRLQALWPVQFSSYCEPFLGGGAHLLRVLEACPSMPCDACDIDADLIATWAAVRANPLAVIERLDVLALDQSEAAYYEARHRFNGPRAWADETAALLIYLNKTGFNGLFRRNRDGLYNVPWGRGLQSKRLYDPENISAVSAAIGGVRLWLGSWQGMLDCVKSGAFAYLDPPYLGGFSAYGGQPFGENEWARVAQWCRGAAARGVEVMVSSADGPIERDLFRGLDCTEIIAPRTISRGTGLPARELVWRNYTD